MDDNRLWKIFGIGCGALALVTILGVVVVVVLFPIPFGRILGQATATPIGDGTQETAEPVPTFTPAPTRTPGTNSGSEVPNIGAVSLTALYDELTPGVVSIRVFVEQGQTVGQGAGSGFVLNEEGHIVTNNHVVEGAERVTVSFYNGIEVGAEIVGTDADSDLAVIQVDGMPEGVRPLALGNSDDVEPGDWTVAIGNPFGFGGSMTLGIVSAVERSIPSGVARYSIPEAIQTDAAINPGNSGGPLLNLSGEVIGVNAQIQTSGASRANAGVGFAIPANIVRMVAPALIETGSYTWPQIGVSGLGLNLLIREANDLDVQLGAYIDSVAPGGPADEAGLQGSTGQTEVDGFVVPVGGDVIVEAAGERVDSFDDLVAVVALSQPGETITLTLIRDGERVEVDVTLVARD